MPAPAHPTTPQYKDDNPPLQKGQLTSSYQQRALTTSPPTLAPHPEHKIHPLSLPPPDLIPNSVDVELTSQHGIHNLGNLEIRKYRCPPETTLDTIRVIVGPTADICCVHIPLLDCRLPYLPPGCLRQPVLSLYFGQPSLISRLMWMDTCADL